MWSLLASACARRSVCQVCLHDNSSSVQGSPNLDQRCKNLSEDPFCFVKRSILICKVKFNLKVEIVPIIDLVHTIDYHPFKLGTPDMDQRCTLPRLLSIVWVGGGVLTYIPRQLQGLECYTVSTLCTHIDLCSRGCFGVLRHSWCPMFCSISLTRVKWGFRYVHIDVFYRYQIHPTIVCLLPCLHNAEIAK